MEVASILKGQDIAALRGRAVAKSLFKIVKNNKALLGVFLALEVMSIPAAAKMAERVKFGPKPMVIVADVPNQLSGQDSFLVSSNTPFVVEVGGVVGEVKVDIATGGYIGTMLYGNNAQMPGVERACSMGRFGTVEAYRSERKTAAKRGSVKSQAVRVNVRYDRIASPNIRIVPVIDSVSLPGRACKDEN